MFSSLRCQGMLAWPALSQAGVLGPLAHLSYKDRSCSGARNLGSQLLLDGLKCHFRTWTHS